MKWLVVCLTLILAIQPVQAAEHAPKQTGIEIKPALVDVEIKADQPEKEIFITLTNNTSETTSLNLFAINFQTKQDSGIVQFLTDVKDNMSYSLSSFVRLPYPEVVLEPGESRQVPITIENRQDLSPGGHYAALIARLKPSDTSDPDTSQVLPSLTSLLLIKKTGGEMYNLSLRSTSFPKRTVYFSFPTSIDLLFRNEGNIHLIPRGTIHIRDMFGRLVAQGIINVSSGYVFPTSQRSYPIDIIRTNSTLPIMLHTVTIQGNDSLKKTQFTSKQSYIYIHPAMFALALLVICAYPFAKWKQKRRLNAR